MIYSQITTFLYLDPPAYDREEHECLEEEQLARIRSTFEQLHYGDGIISEDEFIKMSSDLGRKELTREQAKEEVRKADLNGDGQVEFIEFKKRLEKLEARTNRNWHIFLVIDANHDSNISSEEWRNVMIALNKDASKETETQWRNKLDTDGDDFVSCKEFTQVDDPLFS